VEGGRAFLSLGGRGRKGLGEPVFGPAEKISSQKNSTSLFIKHKGEGVRGKRSKVLGACD